jgi:hypothetical protein
MDLLLLQTLANLKDFGCNAHPMDGQPGNGLCLSGGSITAPFIRDWPHPVSKNQCIAAVGSARMRSSSMG